MTSSTLLLYMEQQAVLEGEAAVLEVVPDFKDGMAAVVLGRTLFYPQGGGQPFDQGWIKGEAGRFQVEEVRFQGGIVHHLGRPAARPFQAGDAVTLQVDGERRRLHSRLHTAGHLIDEAVWNLGLGWQPAKGVHAPGQSAVEYRADAVPAPDAAALIEAELNRLIRHGFPTRTELVSREELPKRARFVPDNLPLDKPVRLVTVWDERGLPCGGTHVADIREVGPVIIRYVKARKNMVKVAYELEAGT
ncbi:alanine--tRNA ligase-related protein [Geminicoccus harenae]|uniref:alanine--tRNA ligase-related protein n=1 Tax=Geminicoccus harenae TaxID=2498453 RepID=UPI00168ADA38|nr:alanine--tRNA ligase-related protein [Geminicoccus harenae]